MSTRKNSGIKPPEMSLLKSNTNSNQYILTTLRKNKTSTEKLANTSIKSLADAASTSTISTHTLTPTYPRTSFKTSTTDIANATDTLIPTSNISTSFKSPTTDIDSAADTLITNTNSKAHPSGSTTPDKIHQTSISAFSKRTLSSFIK